MSGSGVAEFLGYWIEEGEHYVRRGDYEWMAALVPGRRILEIGCGVGHATQALARRGLNVLAVDVLDESLEATRQRVAGLDVVLLKAEVTALDDEQRAGLKLLHLIPWSAG